MIFEAIATIRRTRHLSILLVEQRVVEGLDLCDRGAVLEIGRIVMEGDRDALLNDERIKSAYLGT
jgi:branched-chain amino acid transport system ATP-binding protein